MTDNKRVLFIDVAKCLGMFMIYLGHFGEAAGAAYEFVFKFHVPLFFFLSGCMSNYNNASFPEFIKSRFKRIMVPFWLFSFFSILVKVLSEKIPAPTVNEYIITVLEGCVRNTFFVGGLWFLTCLFVMEILFRLLKLLKNRWLIFAVCFLISLLYGLYFYDGPKWFYNIDTALYLIVYYALGYAVYPKILKLFELDSRGKKIAFTVAGAVSLLYGASVFFGYDYLNPLLSKNALTGAVCTVLQTSVLIWLTLSVSKCFERAAVLRNTGKESLMLCGNEYIVKVSVHDLLASLKLRPEFWSPLGVCLYVVVLFAVCVKLIFPLERKAAACVRCLFEKKREP